MSRIGHSSSGFEPQYQQFNGNFTSDRQKFYEKFFQDEKLSRAYITTARKYEDQNNKQYIAYVIKVETDQLTYEIPKRYSEFQSFKHEIENKVEKAVYSEFPPKKYFGNQEPEVVEVRKAGLNHFICNLVEVLRNSFVPEIYEFLEVYNRYQVNQISINSSFQRNQASQIRNLASSPNEMTDQNEIQEMLILLNNHSDEQIQNYRQIEERYGKQRPKLDFKSLKLLLHGNDQYKGLIKIVGQQTNEELLSKNNHIQCSAGLQLLSKLLDFEFNRDAETYIRVFSKETPVPMYQELRLDKHISDLPANNCRQYAFQLLSKYADKNQDKNVYKMMVENFKLSQQSLEEYKKWNQQKQQEITNQYQKRSQQETFKQEKDKLFQQNSNDDMALQIDNFLLQEWKTVRKDESHYKIKTQYCGSQLFKITCYFPTEKENLLDFFLDKQFIWDKRCREYRELKEEDVNDKSILPISYEQYVSSTNQIMFLYKMQKLSEQNYIKIYKQKVDCDQINKLIYQNNKLADWGVYYLFQDYDKKSKPDLKCKVTQIIQHYNDNFFLSEMTGDKNETVESLINLMKHVSQKYCKHQ